MTLRQYILFMLILTAFCWGGWVAVITFIDPTTGGVLGLALFYTTLGLASWGTLAVVGTGLRSLIRRKVAPARHVGAAFRQGFLLTVAILSALILQSRGLLNGFNTLLLVMALALAELILISFRAER